MSLLTEVLLKWVSKMYTVGLMIPLILSLFYAQLYTKYTMHCPIITDGTGMKVE